MRMILRALFVVALSTTPAAAQSIAGVPDRTVKWTGVRIPPPPATPKTHDFEPTKFELYFDLVGTQVSVAAKVPKTALAPLKGN